MSTEAFEGKSKVRIPFPYVKSISILSIFQAPSCASLLMCRRCGHLPATVILKDILDFHINYYSDLNKARHHCRALKYQPVLLCLKYFKLIKDTDINLFKKERDLFGSIFIRIRSMHRIFFHIKGNLISNRTAFGFSRIGSADKIT